MSILIKGMEMPKNCGECRLNTMYGLPFACDGWCFAMSPTEPNSKSLATKTRPPHCPLIELPPHGRLIDADELRCLYDFHSYDVDDDDFLTEEIFDKLTVATAVVRQNIDDTPTIIEAED